MKQPPCPYLDRETTIERGSLDVSALAQYEVVSTWYCTYLFHGVRGQLGDGRGRADVEQHCGACTLPGARTRRKTPVSGATPS